MVRLCQGKKTPSGSAAMTLAAAHMSQGRFREAREALQEAHCESNDSRGRDHPKTLKLLISLANFVVAEGTWEEGRTKERWLQEALATSKARLGNEHPLILDLHRALASTAGESWQLAEDHLREALKYSPPDHPKTFEVFRALAVLRQDMGRDMDEFQAALSRCKTVLGEDHPKTLELQMTLAMAWKDAGNLKESKEVLEDALKKSLGAQRWGFAGAGSSLGPTHPLTLDLLRSLATVLMDGRRLRDLAEAEDILREALSKSPEAQTLGIPGGPCDLHGVNC
eukprot:Skav227380  [mRNA]  locus=scaffold1390:105863:107913:- [translate_table: standard]